MGLHGRHVDRPRGGRSNERGSRSPDACARWTIARERAGAIRPSGGGDSGSIGPQPGRRNLEVTEVLRNPEAAIFRGRKSLRIKVITTAVLSGRIGGLGCDGNRSERVGRSPFG